MTSALTLDAADQCDAVADRLDREDRVREARQQHDLEQSRIAQPAVDAIRAINLYDLSPEVVGLILATLARAFEDTPCGFSHWRGKFAVERMNSAETALDELAKEQA